MHFIHGLLGMVGLPKVCLFMGIKVSQQGCAMLKSCSSSKAKIQGQNLKQNSNNTDHGEICVQT